MTTTAAPHQPRDAPSSEIYDEEALGSSSPLMKPVHPRHTPSPTPPPDNSPPEVSPVPSTASGRTKANSRLKVETAAGDAVLVAYLDSNRHADLPREITSQALPSVSGSEPDSPSSSSSSPSPKLTQPPDPLDLKDLAKSALAFSSAQSDIASPRSPNASSDPQPREGRNEDAGNQETTREDGPGPPLPLRWPHGLPLREERVPKALATPFTQREHYSPLHGHGSAPSSASRSTDILSPPASLSQGHRELPPLQIASPRSDSNGHGPLPSIKAHLGDLTLNRIEGGPTLDKPIAVGISQTASFSRSPATNYRRMSSIHSGSQASPPISPNDVHRRELPSPAHSIAMSPYFFTPNGTHHGPFYRPGPDSDYSNLGTEMPSTAGSSGFTPSATSITSEHLGIASFAGSGQVGGYVCTFAGCTAAPFQTQYLLNSHANVHSSARPHYCPVPGCPRSEGGKGFKRKNEMIRHGLVHDSPGYVCPFCPDREHKYPRPDNLQRHVRVHHLDKDKDDPLLREVLSQRPDGPNRGRRRRGVTS